MGQIAGQNWFSTLDLASGYHQLRVAEDSRQYTAFVTPDGHYQYKRIPFGLTNAPAVFQRAINDILGPFRFSFVLVYLDDILIMAKTIKEAFDRLETILRVFAVAGLTLNKNKCSFLQSEVEYLGSIIRNGELRPLPEKVKAVLEFPNLDNVHDIRRFLGLASYFRKYIKDFAIKAKPLTMLTRKNVTWNWGPDQENSFQQLKKELASDPVLALYDPDLETQLHTDASKLGFGGILLQKQKDGNWKPVAYISQQTSECESKYHSFELETMAIVVSVRKLRNLLHGKKFTVVTDCNSLRLSWTKRDLSPRIGRWWLELQEYDFEVLYRPGTQMRHADALSRSPVVNVNLLKESDWVQCVQNEDDYCKSIKEQLKEGTADKFYVMTEEKLCRIVDGTPKIIIPKDVRWRVTRLHHDENGHPGSYRTIEAIKEKYWFTDMRKFVTKYVKRCIPCLCAKKPTGRQRGRLYPIPKVNQPFHTLHLDHLGPFCKSPEGNTFMLVTVDAFTKFTWIEAVPDTSSQYVIKTLKLLMKFFGIPERIITDRGKGFTSKLMTDFCARNNIKHVQNAIACPRANGQVERFNSTILRSMTAVVGENYDAWESKIPEVQCGINGTVNATTGISPAELLYGFRPRLKYDVSVNSQIDRQVNLELSRRNAALNIERKAKNMKQRFDKNRLDPIQYQVGDMVLVERTPMVKGLSSGKLVQKYTGPVQITHVLGNDRYRVQSLSKDRRRFKGVVASDKLKLFKAQKFNYW